MTQQMLHNYFALKPTWRFPWWVTALFVLAGCSLCSSISTMAAGSSQSGSGAGAAGFFILLLAIGFAVAGGYLAYNPIRKYNSRDTITDATFDRWVDWQQEEVFKKRGCDRLGLDYNRIGLLPPDPNAQVVRAPITLRGFHRAPYLIPSSAQDNFIIGEWRTGPDNITRFRRNVYIWFFPRDRKLATYTSVNDAVQPNESSDQTQEYFYQAVSGITTSQKRLDGIRTQGIGSTLAISATEFTLRIENGDQISTPADIVEGHLKTRPSGMEEAVRSLRSLLDDTKLAQLGGAGQGYPSGFPGPQPGYAPGGYPSGGYPGAGYPSGGGYNPGAPGAGYPGGGYAPPQPGYMPGQPAPYPAPYPMPNTPPVGYPLAEPPTYPDAPSAQPPQTPDAGTHS